MKRILIIMFFLILAYLLISCEGERKPIQTKVETDYMSCVVTTTFHWTGVENFYSTHYLSITPKKVGTYVIEGWQAKYRDQDVKEKDVQICAPYVPCTEEISFSNEVYRIEITFSDGVLIQKKEITFGAQYAVQH